MSWLLATSLLCLTNYVAKATTFLDIETQINAAAQQQYNDTNLHIILEPINTNYDGELQILNINCNNKSCIIKAKIGSRTVILSGSKAKEQLVIFAITDIQPGDEINSQNTVLTGIAVSQNSNAYLRTLPDTKERYIARYHIPAQSPISMASVRRLPIITKGQKVKIIYSKNSLTIESRGTALSNSMANGCLKVKEASTAKILDARAVSSNEVVVEKS